MPVISRTIRIPSIVGEIAYGMFIYSIFNDPAIDMTIIDFLSQMGFIYLLFLAGLEINFDVFKKETIRLALVSLASLYLMSFLFWNYLPDSGIAGFFPVLILTTTSVGVVFIALKTAKVEKTRMGQGIIITASIGEVGTILAMILYEVYYLHWESGSLHFIENLFGIAVLMGGAYILIRLVLLFFWWFPHTVQGLSSRGDTSELNVRLSFLVLLTMVAIAAIFNLELILGAFIGGMMLSFVFREKKQLENKLSSIGYGFFIPFFFIKVGWDFEIDHESFVSLFEQAALLFALLIGVRIFMTFAFYPQLRRYGSFNSARAILAVALIFSAPLTLLVAIAKLGIEIGAIDHFMYNALILTAILGGVLGPVGFQYIYPPVLKKGEEPEDISEDTYLENRV